MRAMIIGTFVLLSLVPATFSAQKTPLAGSAWQLVAIQSMDHTRYSPDDPSSYTMTFNADGTVQIVSDCNRARGSWDSPGPKQLTFGPLASSKVLCPPGSLDERFRAQFEWVRSYVLRDGNLYLATLADGAIIEFSPLEDLSPDEQAEVRSMREPRARGMIERWNLNQAPYPAKLTRSPPPRYAPGLPGTG